jgi:hypothetical protein
LAIHEKYNGQDTVQVGNGTGLQILHLGSCSINTNTHPLALNNVLRVPEISKHLLSVHKLARDNNIFFEFHPWYFFIKDQATQSLLLEGRCESGLYPLKPADVAAIKQVFLNFYASLSQWHARFGHPSTQVVQSVLHTNKLPCCHESGVSSVYNSCQLAKSHQLPYSLSIHRSTKNHYNLSFLMCGTYSRFRWRLQVLYQFHR